MNGEATVVCIGKSTQDVFMMSKGAFAPRVTADGKAYEVLPLGSKLDVDNVIFATGGNASNAAVTFARQGLHAKYVWVLGSELSSEIILQELDREGVNTTGVLQDPTSRSGYSTILLAPNGERTILSFHGSIPPSNGAGLRLDVIDSCDWVYLSSLGDITLLEIILTRAKQSKKKVLLNPAGSELAHIDKLKALLNDVDIIIVNKEEAAMLAEGKTVDELVRHLTHYCPLAIVTDGPNGAIATDKKTVVRSWMYEDVPVIDRTGGGDAFASGFLASIIHGANLKQAMLFASANSTSVVSQIGAKAGILKKDVILHDMPISEEKF